MKAVKLCRDCGRPIKNATNFRVVCDGCLRKKEDARRDSVRSLENEDAARRAAEQDKKKRRKSHSKAWTSACAKPLPWASATASMWKGDWISQKERMGASNDQKEIYQTLDVGRCAKKRGRKAGRL